MLRKGRWLPAIFATLMLLGLSLQAKTAEAGDWNWKRYRLKVWLPTGMKPTINNASSFIAKGRGIVLKVKPWKSRRTTSKKAAMYGFRTYTIIKARRIVRELRVGKAGAYTHLILGQGVAQGRPAYFAVIGMNAKRNDNNFYVRMWWRPENHAWVKNRVIKIAQRLRVY